MQRGGPRWLLAAAGVFALVCGGATIGVALTPSVAFQQLLATGTTVMGERIVYPTGAAAKITTGIITMAPGTETGWHTHGMPIAGLIIEGELTVDYGAKGKRTYKEGQSVAEAIGVPHNGRNTGSGPLRLFIVCIGAEGLPTTIPAEH